MNEVYAFETDTVWGIGCCVEDEIAVNKIYEIKNRDRKKRLILMSSKIEYLEKYITNVTDEAREIMKKYFPGAITLIFNKSPLLKDFISPDTVAIRIPNNEDFWNLVENTKSKVLATTSLNISDEEPCKTYKEAYQKFHDKCIIIKPTKERTLINIPSTIVDCTTSPYKILRQGSIKID